MPGIRCSEEELKDRLIKSLDLDDEDEDGNKEEYTLTMGWGVLEERMGRLTDSEGNLVGLAICR